MISPTLGATFVFFICKSSRKKPKHTIRLWWGKMRLNGVKGACTRRQRQSELIVIKSEKYCCYCWHSRWRVTSALRSQCDQICRNFWRFVSYWANAEPTLVILWHYWANFHCYKWPNIVNYLTIWSHCLRSTILWTRYDRNFGAKNWRCKASQRYTFQIVTTLVCWHFSVEKKLFMGGSPGLVVMGRDSQS